MDTTETLRRHLPALAEHLPSGIIIWAEKPYFSLFVTSLDSPPQDRGRIISRKKRKTQRGRHSSPNAGNISRKASASAAFPFTADEKQTSPAFLKNRKNVANSSPCPCKHSSAAPFFFSPAACRHGRPPLPRRPSSLPNGLPSNRRARTVATPPPAALSKPCWNKCVRHAPFSPACPLKTSLHGGNRCARP